jgi:hypothetical protein
MKAFGMAKCLAFCLAGCLCAPLIAQPHYARLDSETIREAFEFGRHNDQSVGVFLSKYVRTFPTPPKGPYIGWIEVRTPYAQVVYAAKDDLQNDTELDAVQKFDHAKLPVIVIVRVYWPPQVVTGSAAMPDSDNSMWKKFPITVSQKGPLIANRKTLLPHYSTSGSDSGDTVTLNDTDMQLEFSTAQISSEMLTVAASSPDGQHVEAKFDLSKLK